MDTKYYTMDNNGNIGCHDCCYATALNNLEINKELYPNDEWEMFVQD